MNSCNNWLALSASVYANFYFPVRSFPPHGLVRNGRHEHEYGQHVWGVHVQRDRRREAYAVPTRAAQKATRPLHASSGKSRRDAVEVEIQLHTFFHLALSGGKWPASHLGRFKHGKDATYS